MTATSDNETIVIPPLPTPERVLVILAHPDDPEFGAGGTVARLAAQGARVTFVIVTDGSKGTEDAAFTHDTLFQTRQQEQINAAAVLGVQDVHFLGFPDGQIYNNEELREALVRQIRTHRPDLLITHDPTTRFWRGTRINHPDHRAVGDTALDAVFPLARDRLNFLAHEEEGLEPYKVLDILLTGTNEPNFAVDISEVFDLKIRAICEHVSQIRDPEGLRERMMSFGAEMAAPYGVQAVEVFRRIILEG
jgi:LmbE family N-acetylglucosaminyl deacetylase